MGTPEFAVPSLDILLKHEYNVVGVITAPDKPRGRGQQLAISPVKKFALDNNLRLLQPEKLKEVKFLEHLKSLKADLQVVVAFRMLPEVVWNMPASGTFNLHASLLPDYRGAAPINWAIINGESKTGLTTFFIDKEIDTGKIILQEEENIDPDDDAGSLHDRMMVKGAGLVLKTADMIREKKVATRVQTLTGIPKTAPKITREMCEIDFTKTATEVKNFIRGLSPYPGAWTCIGTKVVKIFKAEAGKADFHGRPGCYVTDRKTELNFQTQDRLIRVLELQVEGKKRMTTVEYFRGNRL